MDVVFEGRRNMNVGLGVLNGNIDPCRIDRTLMEVRVGTGTGRVQGEVVGVLGVLILTRRFCTFVCALP